MKLRCAVILSMALAGVAGCGESTEIGGPAAGFVLLEFDRGPVVDGAPFELLSATLQFATTEETDSNLRAATHGVYATDGFIDNGNCIALGDLLSFELEATDVGDTVTLASSSSNIEFARAGSGADLTYGVVSETAPFVDPALAELNADYTLSWSGSSVIEAGEFAQTLYMPTEMTGTTPETLQNGDTFAINPDEEMVVEWDTLEGVDRVFIRFHDPAGAAVTTCMVEDTGSFTLTPAVLGQQLTSGFLAIGYVFESSDELLGKDFQLLGSSCAFGAYAMQ